MKPGQKAPKARKPEKPENARTVPTIISPPFGRHVEERHKRQCGEEDGHDVADHDAAMLVEEEEWEVIQGRF